MGFPELSVGGGRGFPAESVGGGGFWHYNKQIIVNKLPNIITKKAFTFYIHSRMEISIFKKLTVISNQFH